MSNKLQSMTYRFENIGKIIKKSKVKHLWIFKLDNEKYELELFESKISGKRQIMLNKDIKFMVKKPANRYPFKIGIHSLELVERSTGAFELLIIEESFNKSRSSPKIKTYNMRSVTPILQRDDNKKPIKKEFESSSSFIEPSIMRNRNSLPNHPDLLGKLQPSKLISFGKSRKNHITAKMAYDTFMHKQLSLIN